MIATGTPFEQELFQGKNIKTNTQNGYICNLRRLNNKHEITSLDFLNAPADILARLQAKNKPRTVLNYCICICSVLKNRPGYEDLYGVYSKYILDIHEGLDAVDNTVKTPAQEENWLTYPQVMERRNQLEADVDALPAGEMTSVAWNKVLEMLVLSLYCLTQPRRTLDYSQMVFCKAVPDVLDPTKNYCDVKTSRFVFTNYKTSTKYDTQTVNITPELVSILKKYLRLHPLSKDFRKKSCVSVPFIVDSLGAPLCSGEKNDSYKITKMLNKIFGKPVSVNLIRSIYATHFLGGEMGAQQTAENMGTSMEMLDKVYIKKPLAG